MSDQELSRRQFIRSVAYITPAILSLAVVPSYAKPGSDNGKQKDNEKKDKERKD